MVEEKIYSIYRTGKRRFGDCLLSGYLTAILRDNGIPAYNYSRIRNLLDVPSLSEEMKQTHPNICWHPIQYAPRKDKGPFILQMIENFKIMTNISMDIKININYIPVVYHDIPNVSSFDVTICSMSSGFSIYRHWPYFPELKRLLRKEGFSYFDLNENCVLDIELLNYVKKSRLYVGIDTGASHYVSQVANGKALILQSGHSNFRDWCSYDFEEISFKTPCRRCFLNISDDNRNNGCKEYHVCMRNLYPEVVFKRIKDRLNKKIKPLPLYESLS